MSVKHGSSEQEKKIRAEIDEAAKLSRETKEKMLAEQMVIKSLGPNVLEKLQDEELSERKKIELGTGSFINLDKIIQRVAEAKEVNKSRDQSYAKWDLLRLKVNNLETLLERLRIEFNRVVKEDYAKGHRQ